VSDADCARSGCALSKTIPTRVAPADRKVIFLVNIRFSLV
jgi:hypothetical protein